MADQKSVDKIVLEFENGKLIAKPEKVGINISGPNLPEITIMRGSDRSGPAESIYHIVFKTQDNYPGYVVSLGPKGVIPYEPEPKKEK